jgi:hypothetical protein
MAKKKKEETAKVKGKQAPSGPTPEQIEVAKAQREHQIKMMQLSKIYEETLEPKVVLLFRRIEEMIAASQMPLTHINLVLSLLQHQCVDMAKTAYIDKGNEKLMNIKGGSIG